MRLKNLFDETDDSRAVSPVIGVILMVAITVILAAVIGTFVLGLGSNINSTPQASMDFDLNENPNDDANGYINISHRGGDTLDNSSIEFRTNGTDVTNTNNAGTSDTAIISGPGDQIGAGDTIAIQLNKDLSGETVDIVFVGTEGEATIIDSYDIPQNADL